MEIYSFKRQPADDASVVPGYTILMETSINMRHPTNHRIITSPVSLSEEESKSRHSNNGRKFFQKKCFHADKAEENNSAALEMDRLLRIKEGNMF